MSDLKSFLAQGWQDHAQDPSGVADRLGQGLALIDDAAGVTDLAALAHHVYGAHLAQWRQGLEFLAHLDGLATVEREGASGLALRRFGASLRLCSGDADARIALAPTEAIRVGAMAAANLAEHDTPRAMQLLREALAAAETQALPDSDPVHRALAASSNNLAATLEEKSSRSDDERALMIAAAQAARVHWAKAGTWLEVERAEYRLAMTWLQAGDAGQARVHAQACLDIIDSNGSAALERFFACEALGLAALAMKDDAALHSSLNAMREAHAALGADDRAWCTASLDKLAASATQRLGTAPLAPQVAP